MAFLDANGVTRLVTDLNSIYEYKISAGGGIAINANNVLSTDVQLADNATSAVIYTASGYKWGVRVDDSVNDVSYYLRGTSGNLVFATRTPAAPSSGTMTNDWQMFPSRIPQFNNNTSTTVSSVTSTYTYTGATSSSGTAYWYHYMDDSHIYGWVRLNCGNATSSTSKSTVLNLPTAFTSGITISTGTNDGGRFFITPFGTNGGTVDRMWVNAYTATNVTVNCTVASANTTAIPMNMMFFYNYTKNS